MTLSKSQVRKAGSTVRAYKIRHEVSIDEYQQALDVISQYRSSVSVPLGKVGMGLRSFVGAVGVDAEVSQRLKRMDTIVEKLSIRESGLSLDRMVDVGGCRVVFAGNNLEELRAFEQHIRCKWYEALQIKRCKDYVAQPRESGYRAVHLVVKRDDRLVEIQLRTQRMHQWAQMVEGLSATLGVNFKQDGGGTSVDRFARALSKVHQGLDGMCELTAQDYDELTRCYHDLQHLLIQGAREGGAGRD